MPYLHLSVSPKLDEQQISAIHQAVADTIVLLPGKNYNATTIHIQNNQCISRIAPSTSCGFCDIRLFGPAPTGTKRVFVKTFTARMTEITGIPSTHLTFNIIELETWGGGGDMKSFR